MGEDALKNGIPVGVSSWRQRSFNAIPPAVKSSASYMNSILAKLEAKNHGYAEAVMLNEQGYVCLLYTSELCFPSFFSHGR